MKNRILINGKKLNKNQLRSISGGAIIDCFAGSCLDESCPPANEYGCTIISYACGQKECRPDDCKTCYPINE